MASILHRNLEQRETLSGKVHYLELRLAEKEDEINLLIRKNHLETKNLKAQIHNEQKKVKEIQKKLEKFNSSSTIDSGYDTIKVLAIIESRLHLNLFFAICVSAELSRPKPFDDPSLKLFSAKAGARIRKRYENTDSSGKEDRDDSGGAK